MLRVHLSAEMFCLIHNLLLYFLEDRAKSVCGYICGHNNSADIDSPRPAAGRQYTGEFRQRGRCQLQINIHCINFRFWIYLAEFAGLRLHYAQNAYVSVDEIEVQ